LKKGSPLDAALERRAVQKSGALYGVAFHSPAPSDAPAADIIIPETVKRGEIQLGRFEVTRAQYAVFDKDYKVESGTENFPVNGISPDQARAYCKWLANVTGETYRLPNESEVAALYKVHAGENTLDFWAGYSVNPEDAAKLEDEIKQLPGDAPLLREVGSFPGQGEKGEELIFDLGGNVSEWVITTDNSPKTLGGSADRPADAKSQFRFADPAYTGFRVIHVAAPAPPPPAPADRPAPERPTRPTRPNRTNRAPRLKAQPAPEQEPAPVPEAPHKPDASPTPDAPPTPPAPDAQPAQPAQAPDQPQAPAPVPSPDSSSPSGAPQAPDPAQAPEEPQNQTPQPNSQF
jgi:hypothetical protein